MNLGRRIVCKHSCRTLLSQAGAPAWFTACHRSARIGWLTPQSRYVRNCSESTGQVCSRQVLITTTCPEVAEREERRLKALVASAEPDLVAPKEFSIQYRGVVRREYELSTGSVYRLIMKLANQESDQFRMQVVVQFIQHKSRCHWQASRSTAPPEQTSFAFRQTPRPCSAPPAFRLRVDVGGGRPQRQRLQSLWRCGR